VRRYTEVSACFMAGIICLVYTACGGMVSVAYTDVIQSAIGMTGRGLTSSTSQLNLSQFWSLKPKLVSTSQLDVSHFGNLNTQPSQPKVLTTI
jgi:Na+(H+)/acetate symporter ActP